MNLLVNGLIYSSCCHHPFSTIGTLMHMLLNPQMFQVKYGAATSGTALILTLSAEFSLLLNGFLLELVSRIYLYANWQR
jgi:hypothetical protein